MIEGTKGERGMKKKRREKRFHTGASRAFPAKGYSLQPLWSTWLAVAIPSLPSKHEGRGRHRDHCLCFNKTFLVELSSEADLPVCCSLSTASQILYWVILVTVFLGCHSVVISTGVLLLTRQNGCLSQGVGRHSPSRII